MGSRSGNGFSTGIEADAPPEVSLRMLISSESGDDIVQSGLGPPVQGPNEGASPDAGYSPVTGTEVRFDLCGAAGMSMRRNPFW